MIVSHRLIRRSSPNLNYIIGLGAIILYLNVISFVIPTTNPDFMSVLCNVSSAVLCYVNLSVNVAHVLRYNTLNMHIYRSIPG